MLQRIVSWALNKFTAKNTYSGKLEYADMPVVVLASMGSELDGTSTQRPMSAGDTYYLPAGQGAGARIMFVDSNGRAVKISDPVSNVIYCNAYTGLLYRWDASESDMVSVGGDGDGLRKVYVRTNDFSSLDALNSAEASGVYQVIGQSSQKIIGILVVSSDNTPFIVTQWLFSALVLSDEFSGSLTGEQYANGRAHIIHRFYNVSNTSSDIPLNTWSEWKVYGLTLDEMSELLGAKANAADLASVATSGSYNDLSNKPTLFSGNYNDLTNKPSIPAAQVNADWNASSGVMEILNKPTIPTKFSDLVDDSDYIKAEDVASIVVGSADVVITETPSHICITFVTSSITFTPNTTMSLWSGQKVGTLTVSGTHLKQDITLTVPSGFTAQVSGGTAAQSITIPQTGGEVSGVSVTITYKGADSGSYTGSITATSGSTTASVGLVYSQYQGATIIAGTIGTIKAAIGSPQIGELNVSGVNLEDDISASVGNGDFTICATQNGTYGTTATISKASAEASGGATLYVKYTPSSGTSTASGTLTLTTPRNGVNMSKTVTLTGAVSTLTLSTNSVSISTDQNVAATGTFTIQGSNLTNGVTLALTDANSVFSLSKNSLTKAEAEAGETITITYNSSAAGNHSGSIAVNWDGTTQTVSLSGTAAVAATSDAEGKFTKEINGKTLYLKRKIVDGQKTNEVEVHQSNYNTGWQEVNVADTYSGNIVIPSTVVVDGVSCNITTIASNAFRFNSKKSQLTSLTLPEGITTIGGYFLYQAQAVTSIIIPSTVTTINGGFCIRATNLETIDMRCQKNPNFQTTWGDANNPHCKNCTKLTSFVVPDKVERFIEGSYKPFENCPALTEITLGTDLIVFRSLFSSATGVTKIYCRSTTPPLINELSNQTSSIPSTVYQNAQVYVPTGYKQAYLDVDDGRPANGKVWYPFEQYHALIEYNPD